MTRLLMLDLFSGTGGASAAFRESPDWQVVRVELAPHFPAEVHADIRDFRWTGWPPTLIWASPPCTEFARESMPWSRTGQVPAMGLIEATERVIRGAAPVYWVIENVRGASPYLTPRYGRPLILGPVYLWGRFPPFRVQVPPWKERLSSTDKAGRAAIPYQISAGLLDAVERDLFSPVVNT